MDSAYLETQIQLARRKRMMPPDEIGVSTEVAHIIPHAFNSLKSDGTFVNNFPCFPPSQKADDYTQKCESKAFIWRVMNLFDPGISKQLQASNIDTPSNAITLCVELHKRFGDLKWYLEEVPVRFCLPSHTILYCTIGTKIFPSFRTHQRVHIPSIRYAAALCSATTCPKRRPLCSLHIKKEFQYQIQDC